MDEFLIDQNKILEELNEKELKQMESEMREKQMYYYLVYFNKEEKS